MVRHKQSPADIDNSESLLTEIMEDYLLKLERGEQPDRSAYLKKYPQLAETLDVALDGLDFLNHTAPKVQSPTDEDSVVSEAESTLGDFRLVRLLGRGGMGIVYEAEQISLKRRVALKILPFAQLLDAKQLQRFNNEARAAAMLKHSNIVSVYQVGVERGTHFYAMELIDGCTLADIIEHRQTENTQSVEDSSQKESSTDLETVPIAALSTVDSGDRRSFYSNVAILGIQTAEALHHAHQEGIVHRDIKPSNLLLDQNGQLHVTDFGLARVRSDDVLTATGELIGTVRYMSPEQASGDHGFVDHRTDVYSLGVTLYELLTGQPAVPGADRIELFRNIDREIVPPIKLDSRIPRDLNNIILKATAHRPEERYPSAEGLKDDLQRFIDHRPVKARRANGFVRAIRWTQRRPMQATLLASTVLLSLALAIGGLWTSFALNSKVDELGRQNYSLWMTAALQAWEDYRLTEVERCLENAIREAGENRPGFAHDHLAGRLKYALNVPTAPPHGGPVNKVIYTPDGKQVVTACDDGYIRFLDAERLTLKKQIKAHDQEILWIEYSPDRKLFISAGFDRSVQLRDAKSLSLMATYRDHANAVSQVSFSPNGRFLITLMTNAGKPIVWKLHNRDGEWIKDPVDELDHPVTFACFSTDSKTLVTYHVHGGAQVWSLGNRDSDKINLVCQLKTSPGEHVFSQDGKELIVAGQRLEIWDTATWDIKRVLAGSIQSNSVALNQQNSTIISAGFDPIRIWDPSQPGVFRQVPSHMQQIKSLAVSPDGESLVAASREGDVRRFHLSEYPIPVASDRAWKCLTISDIGNDDESQFHAVLAATPKDRNYREERSYLDMVNLRTGTRYNLERGRSYSGIDVNSVDKRLLAVGGGSLGKGVVDIWDITTRKKFWSIPTKILGKVFDVSFSHDGTKLAVVGGKGALQNRSFEVWDLNSNKLIHSIEGYVGFGVSFSPDDETLIICGGDWNNGICYEFDVATWEFNSEFRVHTSAAIAAKFTATGKILGVTNNEGAFRIFSWPSKEVLIDAKRFRPFHSSFAISPDEQTVAVAAGRAMEIWRIDTQQHLGSIQVNHNVGAPIFTPDGNQLLWIGDQGSLHIWHRNGRTQVIPTVE